MEYQGVAANALAAPFVQAAVGQIGTDTGGTPIGAAAAVQLAAAMVRAGWTLDYRKYTAGRPIPAKNRMLAKQGRGLWGQAFEVPCEWRHLPHSGGDRR